MARSSASPRRGLAILAGLTLGLVIATTLLGGAERSAPAGRVPFAALLPADTLVQLTLSGEPCSGRGRRLALAQLFREEEVQQFLAPVQRQTEILLKGVDRSLQRSAGVALDDLLQLGDATLSVALLGMEERLVDHGDYKEERIDPDLALILDFGKDIETVRKLVAAGEAMAKRMGLGEVEEIELEGVTVRRLHVPMGGAHDIHHVIRGDRFIACNRGESLAGILRRVRDGGAEDCLVTQPAFKEVQRRVLRPASVLSAYVNVAGIVEAFRSEISSELAPLLALSGLSGIEACGYGCDIDGAGFRDRFYLHMPSPQGPFKKVFPHEASVQATALAPGDAPFFFAGTCSFADLLDWVAEVLVAVEPGGARFLEAMVKRADGALGMSLRDDVLANLGPEFGLFASLPRYGLIPEPVAFLRVKDREKIVAAMAATAELLSEELEVHELTYLDHRLQYFALDTWDSSLVEVPPLKPTWALVGDYLVVSLWPQAIKHLVRGLAAQAPRLDESSEMTRLLAHLRSEDPRAGTAKLFYLDLRRTVGFLCDNGVPFFQSAVPAIPGVELDWAAFPVTDTLTGHLFGLIGGSSWTEKGGYGEIYSPVGLGPGLLVLGGGGYFVAPRRSRGSATIRPR